jgi:hypothetical protein
MFRYYSKTLVKQTSKPAVNIFIIDPFFLLSFSSFFNHFLAYQMLYLVGCEAT